MTGLKQIAVITTQSGARGGAERLNQALIKAVEAAGCRCREISLPAPEPDAAAILENYDAFAGLDLSGFDAVISTKAPTYAVRHPNHILYLVHTVRAFDDMFHQVFPRPAPADYSFRHQIQARDFQALSGVRKRFAIGHEVAARLYRWRGMTADVLHPPLALDGFYQAGAGDYFFLPGRLHEWKRVDLAIRAVLDSDLPMKLVVAGTGEQEKALVRLARGDRRIEFPGHVTDARLRDLYAGALAVPFLPVREDYGYVTLEAFASGKPVITCTDSGEPARFVRPYGTGLICRPDADDVRRAMEWMYTHPDRAADMGKAGRAAVEAMSWDTTAGKLLAAAFPEFRESRDSGDTHDMRQVHAPPKTRSSDHSGDPGPGLRTAVFDMQPIDPPVGGGRQRLLGLYHHLGEGRPCRYLGSYDWDGEPFREQALTPLLHETLVPLSKAHHRAAADLSRQCRDKVVIDMAFSRQAALSPEYLSRAAAALAGADVVVFSHPWVYPLLEDRLQPHQVVVYDAQNVEGFLRAQLLDGSCPHQAGLLKAVVEDEYRCGAGSDLILACSHEDLARFHRIYEFSPDVMRVVPNGVMAFADTPADDPERRDLRRDLGLDPGAFTAVFIGSPYGPNVEAARFIAEDLAPAMPEVTFIIAGGVGQTVSASTRNVVCTGPLAEPDKNRWLKAADIAVNPMFAGSGTNIKMFDFMALGLPVVTTATGARGIDCGAEPAFLQVGNNAADFVQAITRLKVRPEACKTLGRAARQCVENGYAWERISRHLGAMLHHRARMAGQPRPLFSVVIPTYARHPQLDRVMAGLSAQVEQDFEVIVVDQSGTPWPGRHRAFGFPVVYCHTPVKGAVRARNTGAALAAGDILAFTDDDCQPQPDWLLNARPYFDDPGTAGVEGRVESDHLDDPDFRPVTNVGFTGMGFMTANLMVRSALFQLSGGFDLQFDHPHFREDTDLGWRLQNYGNLPYGEDVVVFHPAQPRKLARESVTARAAFFRKDARLYARHPEKYRDLFFCERHFETMPDLFARHLLAGFRETGQTPPGWMLRHLPAHEITGHPQFPPGDGQTPETPGR
jgi:glycosyltransferase involved in cell wall biosynthesis/GT2 family glycosyltransferase